MRAAGTSQEELQLLLLDSDEINTNLRSLLDEFKETGSINNEKGAFLNLAASCEKLGLKAEFIGGGNNKNIIIKSEHDEASVFVQFSKKDRRAATTIKLLYAGDQPARWLPRIVKESSKQEVDTNTKEVTGSIISCTIMETCPQNITRLAKENKAVPQEGSVEIFRQLSAFASQVDAMISMMRKKNIIWKDMKRENFLLRENGDIVVSDTKGFINVNDLSIHRTTGCIQFTDVSKEYLSPYASDHMFEMKKEDIGKVSKAWEREYSYQLAVILYEMATGDIETPTRNNDGKFIKNFNFNHSIFQSDDGQKFKKMLEEMSRPDAPEKRMKCSNCVRALKRMDANQAVSSPRYFGGVRTALDAVKSVLTSRGVTEARRRQSLSESELPEVQNPLPRMDGHRGGKK